MFKALMSNSSIFVDSITTIGELIDEGVFKINKNGMTLIAADRSMVAVVDFKLPATIFDEFKVEGEQSLAINISNLVSVLKRAKPKDKLLMELKENKLEIVMDNSSRRRFTVPLLDISQDEIPPIDQLDFQAKIRVKTDVLKSGIEDADIVGDSVIFEASPEKFNMKASGDVTSTELSLQKGSKSLLDLTASGSVVSRYPLEYLKKMIKAGKLADETTLKWSKDYPMRLDFSSVDKVSLGFVIAPRVAED
ncbi:MAG: proliferating cell nuclear antigen (pcna) [Candidatus Aenigmarchaeota archaeon CG_4_10_14_0_8_um_filter_37_24]|nr:proliferating cell nuclear antigen (pcna) [Candidatus Aenigmarchaeota archaeon]OIN85267.1 MAG: proliferating cell nuclear antigen (pcna) [Candidatus Aenigmarchaeota archaeon CG1_02_38_14]PIV69177.1 MAG: proliferating cell nuclear antigen (pcna) [Candidatus Aenigmarchaeota archaeon CG01_land_8_20_14_3_00_37_9]PIW41003.1 MAG: proliferating cell nuclear antigen (pcna) [Candidatus Aenigmarchaeota archaeon CG15_BIG_FIL_POST_REV_8_21_14_020_37_27]PIX50268.1 MAG: proliferating cell nuclear antigen 